jgi:RPA family protein
MNEVRQREVARRVFAKELNDSTHTVGGGEEKLPVYVLTPLGLKCNRIFIIAALLEKEEVRPDSGIWRVRLADPTGVFIGYVGRFQPEALESLMDIEPPALVSVTSKVRIFEGRTRNFVTLRPEFINLADAQARDWWIVETAKATLRRIEAVENAKKSEANLSNDVKLAVELYNPDVEEYRTVVKEALLRLVEEYRVEEEAEEEEIEEEFEEIIEEEFEFDEEEWDLSDLLEEE